MQSTQLHITVGNTNSPPFLKPSTWLQLIVFLNRNYVWNWRGFWIWLFTRSHCSCPSRWQRSKVWKMLSNKIWRDDLAVHTAFTGYQSYGVVQMVAGILIEWSGLSQKLLDFWNVDEATLIQVFGAYSTVIPFSILEQTLGSQRVKSFDTCYKNPDSGGIIET